MFGYVFVVGSGVIFGDWVFLGEVKFRSKYKLVLKESGFSFVVCRRDSSFFVIVLVNKLRVFFLKEESVLFYLVIFLEFSVYR